MDAPSKAVDGAGMVEIPDLNDPATFVEGVPHDALAHLRASAPVSWHPEHAIGPWAAGPGFWGVFRHRDVVHVNRHPELFSSSLGATQIRDLPHDDLEFVREMLLNQDPPSHTALRRAVNRAFTPRSVKALEDTIWHRARSIVADVAPTGSADLAQDIAADLPLLTLAEIMGVPLEDRRLLYDWSNRIIGYQDDDYAPPETGDDVAPPVNPRSRAALADMFEYAGDLARRKLETPGDDVLSALLHAEVDGEAISVEQFENFFFLLAVAGNETLRNGIPGGLLTLIEHPDQLALVRDDPSLVPGAVEEMLRHHTPVVHFRRTATEDTEVGGQAIAAGDKVVVFYASANRDEDVFADPQRFDVLRSPNDHLSFGIGPHFCLGAGFARTQMIAMVTAVLEGLPGIRVAGDPVRLASAFQAGFKRLPVSWDT